MSSIVSFLVRAAGLLGFSVSPFAAGAAVAIAIVAALGITHLKAFNAGAGREATKCQVASLRSQVEQLRADVQIARSAERDGADRVRGIEADASKQKAQDDAYIKTLEGKIGTGCIPTDDDLRSLQPSNRWRNIDRTKPAPRPG